MAHLATHIPSWFQRYVDEGAPDSRYRVVDKVETTVTVPDTEWEAQHMAWLCDHDRMAVCCGCQECAELIYDVLEACAQAHGEEFP